MSDEITRVEILCRDRDVGKVQRLMVGIALEPPKSQPVVNARFGKNGVSAASSGNICDMFLDHVTKNKILVMTPSEIDAWCKAHNRTAKSSRYSVIACGKKAGYVKKRGKGKFVEYVIDLTKANKMRA